jgi:hypothetical protein
MPIEFDPSEEVELVISFGTVQLLKEANKILKLFEEDDVVREIMNVIDMLYDSSVEYLSAVSGEEIIEPDEYPGDEDLDEEDEDMAMGIESEDEYE